MERTLSRVRGNLLPSFVFASANLAVASRLRDSANSHRFYKPPQGVLRGFLYGADIEPSTRQLVAVVRRLFRRLKNLYGFTRRKSLRNTSALQSLGMRQSPRGESATEPTFTPSGKQERLNC